MEEIVVSLIVGYLFGMMITSAAFIISERVEYKIIPLIIGFFLGGFIVGYLYSYMLGM